jgi:hypothetical protein
LYSEKKISAKKCLYLKINLLEPINGKNKSEILEKNLNYLSMGLSINFKNWKKIKIDTQIHIQKLENFFCI